MAKERMKQAVIERALAAKRVQVSLLIFLVITKSRISANNKTTAHPSIKLLKVMNMGALAVAATAAVTP